MQCPSRRSIFSHNLNILAPWKFPTPGFDRSLPLKSQEPFERFFDHSIVSPYPGDTLSFCEKLIIDNDIGSHGDLDLTPEVAEDKAIVERHAPRLVHALDSSQLPQRSLNSFYNPPSSLTMTAHCTLLSVSFRQLPVSLIF